MKPNRVDVYRPMYKNRDHRPDYIASDGTNECPTSLITPESIWLLGEFHGARAAHKTTGAALRGQDSARWPAWWFDAVTALTSAQSEADTIEMSGKNG